MADHKNKKDFRDRNRVAANKTYEVEYLTKEPNATKEEVKEQLKR